MKLITVVVKADLSDEGNVYMDGTTIADHLDEILSPRGYNGVSIEFGTGDVVNDSTLVAISIVEAL